jgi:hypothetical protein
MKIRSSLQWPSHVSGALQGGDIVKSFKLNRDPAALHQLIKAKVNVRAGHQEGA